MDSIPPTVLPCMVLPNTQELAEPLSAWWKEAVFYQIYPLSFFDSDGDGFGDLDGLESKLDYLVWLGIDALWLSPVYRSPLRDWGYDVTDHTDIDPVFGDLGNFERVLESVHTRGLKLIMDLIINHTSDEHPWFQESRSSLDNPKRDWYVWVQGGPDKPPTNWVSVFSGPAWSWDPRTEHWYRHTYLPGQPDLNWRNPEVVDAMLDVIRFWLDRGVDGFRVDAAHQILKDPQLRDNPLVSPGYVDPYKDMGDYGKFVHIHDVGQSEVHDIHRSIRTLVDSYPGDRVTVSEIHEFDPARWISYYGYDDELHMPFNYQLLASDWTSDSVRNAIRRVEGVLPLFAWTNWTMGNHDEIRTATRIGDSGARQAAVLLLTLRGSPFLYYGDEVGMLNGERQGRDPWGRTVSFLSRDGCRTPMQWDASSDTGFGSSRPWMPVGPGVDTRNVAVQQEDPESILSLYRSLISLRRGRISLRLGSFQEIGTGEDGLFGFRRQYDSESTDVFVNFGAGPAKLPHSVGQLLASTDTRPAYGKLAPGQAAVFDGAT